jgi:DNA-binding LytR/AlgR family response regulator
MMENNTAKVLLFGESKNGKEILMYRVLICDDDVVSLENMREKVEGVFSGLGIRVKVHIYSDPQIISDQILSSCDLVFLDIDLSNLHCNGLDVARRLRKLRNDTIIIFVTNFIEYAPEGYEVQAFRYILKRDFEYDLEPYIRQALVQLQSYKEKFKIQVNGEIIDILLEDILYFEVQQHNVTVYVLRDQMRNNLKTYCFYATLSEIEQRLEKHGFLRIHKSYLVNMRHLKKFQCREALLDNGMTLRVGEKSYAEKKKEYLLWKGWR